ncbi:MULTISPECIES: ABC transporter ATP-binding protein [unclassified Cryobacterium]|uniref:ABC transporter ATP-binding protein n=1 Tax=unclassified Cryobacterium TaxID=2649013 RepID=UPI0011AFE002|nr:MULTISPECIES: ABC transporter ATP-binding protein [unclassified Cryobacterium]
MGTVSLDHVTKAYGGNVVLNDVSLNIEDGEFVSLLGPSGCGKTTLLRAVAGLHGIEGGRILIDGADVTTLPPQQRPIGMVFQQYSLFPNMSVRQNIAFPLTVMRTTRAQIESRVDEMVELIDLKKHEHKRPNQLSGGQQQRVALARALAPQPRVLLLDEPLSALDALVRTRLRDQLRAIQRAVGITTIFVTHDQSEALAISDKVVLMRQGEIEQVDTPEGIYLKPRTKHAAKFIGSRSVVKVEANAGLLEWHGLFEIDSPVVDGTRVQCTFRSEDVFVQLPGEDASGVAARVDVMIFLGATSTLQLTLCGQADSVEVHQVVAQVPAKVARRLVEGDMVVILVRSEDVTVFVDGTLMDRAASLLAVSHV